VPRSADFRFVFTNTLGFQFSDNDARIIFSIDEGNGVDGALDQVGVAMTHKTLKLLGAIVHEMLEHYETSSGVKIPVDQDKIEGFRAVLQKKQG
jgi:hypothetical protein